MQKYIDGFLHVVPQKYLKDYQMVAEKVAEVWKEHGALAYCEFVGDDLHHEGMKSFSTALEVKTEEVILMGWVTFPSKEIRDLANEKVPQDPRMEKLIEPLTQSDRLIFDASRMIYGGFDVLV